MDWYGFCWEDFNSRWLMTHKLTVPLGYMLDNLYERLKYMAGAGWMSLVEPHKARFVGIEMEHALGDLYFVLAKTKR